MTNRRIALLTLALVVAVHLAIVISIARQPLRVSSAPPAERSVIWPLHHDTVHRAGPGGDFFAIYHAGIKSARGESPYDNKENPRVTPEFFPFRYLPVVAQTVGRAVITVPPQTAHIAWMVVLELFLVGCALLLWRDLKSLEWRVAVIAPLLLSSPYFLELHMGQFTFATSALLATGLLCLDRSSKKSLAGGTAAFAAAVLLKVFPLVAGAALLRYRRGFVAGAIAALLVVGVSLPYFLGHEADWRSFATTNFGNTKTEGFHGGNYGGGGYYAPVYRPVVVVPSYGYGGFNNFGYGNPGFNNFGGGYGHNRGFNNGFGYNNFGGFNNGFGHNNFGGFNNGFGRPAVGDFTLTSPSPSPVSISVSPRSRRPAAAPA